MAQVVDLSTSRSGRIWEARSVLRSDGLLSTIMSTTTTQRNKRTVPYCCLSFEAARGDTVAAGDSRGNVAVLWLKRNRYRVWRAGTHTVTALAFVGGGKEVCALNPINRRRR